jgi:hypothetical protein
MRVKTIYTVFIVLCLLNCQGHDSAGKLPTRALELPVKHSSGPLSLFLAGDNLSAIYTDAESASLGVAEIPLGRFEDGKAPIAVFADKIADGPTPLPDFFAYSGGEIDGVLHLLYLDRKRENSPILKWLTHAKNRPWMADVLETQSSSWPIAVVGDGDGNASLFWITGTTLFERLQAGGVREIMSGISPGSRGSVTGTGFSYFDLVSGDLSFFSLRGESVERIVMGNGNPLQCAGRTPMGLPAVMTYAAAERRIYLLEQTGDSGKIKKTTVAPAEETRSLFFTGYRGGYAFLYDGIEKTAEGSVGYFVSLLLPAGRRYEKFTVMESDAPITAFAAVIKDSALYVLALQKSLSLFEVSLPN